MSKILQCKNEMKAAGIRGFQYNMYIMVLPNFILVAILYKPKFCPNTTINFLNPIENNISLYFDCILKKKGAW